MDKVYEDKNALWNTKREGTHGQIDEERFASWSRYLAVNSTCAHLLMALDCRTHTPASSCLTKMQGAIFHDCASKSILWMFDSMIQYSYRCEQYTSQTIVSKKNIYLCLTICLQMIYNNFIMCKNVFL